MKIEPNNIYCGDSYKLIKFIPDNSIDLAILDPPYEIVAGGGGGAFGVENRNYHETVSKNETINCGVRTEILVELERVMKKTNIYIFCNKNQIAQYLNFYKDKKMDILVWEKTNPTPMINGNYLPNLEYIVFIRDHGTYFETVYERSSKIYRSPTNKKDKKDFFHPTIKPEKLIERYMLNSSKPDDLVLDCFLGSGTTAYVAKRLGRRYIGIELKQKYVDIAQDRLKGITVQERKMRDKGLRDIFDFLDEKDL